MLKNIKIQQINPSVIAIYAELPIQISEGGNLAVTEYLSDIRADPAILNIASQCEVFILTDRDSVSKFGFAGPGGHYEFSYFVSLHDYDGLLRDTKYHSVESRRDYLLSCTNIAKDRLIISSN